MSTTLDIASDLQGAGSFSAILSFDTEGLSATWSGAASFVAELIELELFGELVLLGTASFVADGGESDSLPSIIPIAATLEGNDSFIADGSVSDADEEEDGSCSVNYDTEVCCVILFES